MQSVEYLYNPSFWLILLHLKNELSYIDTSHK